MRVHAPQLDALAPRRGTDNNAAAERCAPEGVCMCCWRARVCAQASVVAGAVPEAVPVRLRQTQARMHGVRVKHAHTHTPPPPHTHTHARARTRRVVNQLLTELDGVEGRQVRGAARLAEREHASQAADAVDDLLVSLLRSHHELS